MPIYNAINLDIVSSCMVFSYLFIASIDLLQVGINNIIFPFKKIYILSLKKSHIFLNEIEIELV